MSNLFQVGDKVIANGRQGIIRKIYDFDPPVAIVEISTSSEEVKIYLSQLIKVPTIKADPKETPITRKDMIETVSYILNGFIGALQARVDLGVTNALTTDHLNDLADVFSDVMEQMDSDYIKDMFND